MAVTDWGTKKLIVASLKNNYLKKGHDAAKKIIKMFRSPIEYYFLVGSYPFF